MRMFFAKEEKGELPKGTAKKWVDHTPNIKKLPEHVKKASLESRIAESFTKIAIEMIQPKGTFPKPPTPFKPPAPESVADFRGADNNADETGGALDTGVTPMQQYDSV
jgi:hypothetical protein